MTLDYDTIEEFNVDSKAEYLALSCTHSQKKKLKQTTPVRGAYLIQLNPLHSEDVCSGTTLSISPRLSLCCLTA